MDTTIVNNLHRNWFKIFVIVIFLVFTFFNLFFNNDQRNSFRSDLTELEHFELKFMDQISLEERMQIVSSSRGVSSSNLRFKPQKQTQNCQPILGQPSQFNTIMHMSLPGAGNTWTRNLIEKSTGYLTGSVYNDASLAADLKGELIDPKLNQTITVKNHNPFHKILNDDDHSDDPSLKITGCIFVVRNLVDSILADFTRKSNHNGHVGNLKYTSSEDLLDPNNEEWHNHVNYLTNRFSSMFRIVQEKCKRNAFIIKFEDLIESEEKLLKVVEKTVDFIKANNNYEATKSINFSERVSCLLKDLDGNQKRDHSSRNFEPKDCFSKAEKIKVNNAIYAANKTLVQVYRMDGGLSENYLFTDEEVSSS